jgi:hypothetical protein
VTVRLGEQSNYWSLIIQKVVSGRGVMDLGKEG